MPSLQQLTTTTPYHLLAYGTLLGSNIFQSFVSGVVAYKCLPRAQFSTLQKNTFPVYFTIQTALSGVLALTSFDGPGALFSPANRYTVGVPLTVAIASGLSNLIYFGPETTRVMVERKHQETRDGKKYDDPVRSEEMRSLNKQFGVLHGVSTLTNLAGLGALIWYGFVLAEKLAGDNLLIVKA